MFSFTNENYCHESCCVSLPPSPAGADQLSSGDEAYIDEEQQHERAQLQKSKRAASSPVATPEGSTMPAPPKAARAGIALPPSCLEASSAAAMAQEPAAAAGGGGGPVEGTSEGVQEPPRAALEPHGARSGLFSNRPSFSLNLSVCLVRLR